MDKRKKQRPGGYAAAKQTVAAKKFHRQPFNGHAYKENEPLVLPELINIAFSLVALNFRSEAKGNSEQAHQLAWLWLKGASLFIHHLKFLSPH